MKVVAVEMERKPMQSWFQDLATLAGSEEVERWQ